jgi:alpha-tubulin suppressor-like RCC1 family protein
MNQSIHYRHQMRKTCIYLAFSLIMSLLACSKDNNPVDPPKLLAPMLYSPLNGARGQAMPLKLKWTAVNDAAMYEIQIAASNVFSSIVQDDSTLLADSTIVSGLSGGTTYFWRVRAKNSVAVSPWTNPWSFTTLIASPGLVNPDNGALSQPITPTLTWNTVNSALTYRVQVSTTVACSSTVIDDSTVTDTLKNISTLSYSTTYYWRVNAKDSSETSSWSAIWSFNTIPDPFPVLGVPTLYSPTNGATDQPTSGLQLIWISVTGAAVYHVQVSTSSSFTSITVEDSLLTSASTMISGLSYNSTYYWRARAKNASSESPWSSLWSFTTPKVVISAGGLHTMILTSDGTYWTTGYNTYGQLGTGDTINRLTLVPVPMSSSSAVSAGCYHTMILRSDSTLWATGYNTYGQLGTGDTINRLTFVSVPMSSVSAVSAGFCHTMILRSDSTLWATGYNIYGQLGTGDTINRRSPVQITSITGVAAVSAGGFIILWVGGEHTMILKSDGTLWATGYNNYGQLGTGDTINRRSPVQITSITGVAAVSAGGLHTMILKSDGTLWATGYNICGQLGTGDTINRRSPVQITSITGVAAVSAGAFHTMILKSDGTLWATGYNINGQLGTGDTIARHSPVQITSITGVAAVSAGAFHTMILKSDGTLWATGNNTYGQLGTGDTTRVLIPTQVWP